MDRLVYVTYVCVASGVLVPEIHMQSKKQCLPFRVWRPLRGPVAHANARP